MKKYIYILSAFAVLWTLAGCSKDATTEMPDGDTWLRLSFANPVTYSYEATGEEKRLTSVAFFVQIGDKFYSYFSHRNDFDESNTDTEGNYQAVGVRIATATGTAKVAVVGNYVENGLTDDLLNAASQVNASIDDIFTIKTKSIEVQPIASPFLMYHEPIDVKITGGKSEEKTFNLKRVAARVDFALSLRRNGVEIDLSAYHTQPAVNIYNAKTRSYILPAKSQTDVATLPQQGIYTPALTYTDKGVGFTCYTYESSTNDIAPFLMKVYYEDGRSQELILMLKNGEGNPAIKRNHYYNPDIKIDLVSVP